jgi:ubiquitin C-terminal hydrolase
MDIVGTPKSQHDIYHIKSLEAWSQFYAKGYSPVIESFFGQQMTATICKSCNNKNSRFEPWMMIKAPIDNTKDTQTLSECIDKAFDKEVLEDYQCDNCNKRGQAELEHTISKLPPILIISLKRFDNKNNKIRTKVTVDLDKNDMSKWTSFPAVSKHISTDYSVFAVIEHLGGSRGGHYLSYTKHNDEWVSYDDTNIASVSAKDVINSNSYVLFMTRNNYVSPKPSYKTES